MATTYSFGWLDRRAIEPGLTKDPAAVLEEEDEKFYTVPIKRYKASAVPEYEYVSANPFLEKVIEMEYVGSRVTCNPAPTNTDEDILILTDKSYRLVEDCKAQGFEGGEAYLDGKGGLAVNFLSLRKGEINLIVTESKQFYDKFLLATHVCKTLNVMEKENRIMVFQAIISGNKTKGKP